MPQLKMGHSQNLLLVNSPIIYCVHAAGFVVSALLEGVFCLIEVFGIADFGSCFKNHMFLSEKSPKSYVGLYQKFLYKSFIINDTPSPKHSYHTSPDDTTDDSGPRSTVFCDPQ